MPEVSVAVSDIDGPHAARVAARLGVEFGGSPESLLTSEIDAVDVCVPTPFHASCIIESLLAEKHVFCEKPLAERLDDVRHIMRLSEECDRTVMVGYLYRFHPAFEMIKHAVDAGALAEPYLASLRLGGRGGHRAWKHRAESGGGAINEVLVHMLDLALWFFGDVRSQRVLRAGTILPQRYIPDGRRTIESNAEDFICVELTTPSGCTVFCQGDLVTPGYMNHVEIHGCNGSVFGSILEEIPTRLVLRERRAGFEAGATLRTFPKVDLFAKELEYFVRCAANGASSVEGSIRDSLRLVELTEEIRDQVDLRPRGER